MYYGITEKPEKPIYSEFKTTIRLTSRQAEILNTIGVQEIVGHGDSKVGSWFDNHWVKVTAENLAQIVIELNKHVAEHPSDKNIVTRTIKVLNTEFQSKWSWEVLNYEKQIEQLKAILQEEITTFERVLEIEQYGFSLVLRRQDGFYGERGVTIAPVTFVEDGLPIVKWTVDTDGMYLSMGSGETRRSKQELFETIDGAIVKGHAMLDTIQQEIADLYADRIETAKLWLSQLENA